MLHVLLHMSEQDKPVTSGKIAKILGTNPVVVRRMMSGLRGRKYVKSINGIGGGWLLNCRLEDITLLNVYEALDATTLFAIGFDNRNPGCMVERTVNGVLGEAFEEAEQMILQRLSQLTLAEIAQKMGSDVMKIGNIK